MDKLIEKVNQAHAKLMQVKNSEKGGVATYGVLWMLGVPLSLLVLIWLIRGH